ncbi:hypothetical protein ABZ807_21190 [Micromonospora sp. NPDC047548]|uniref:hypothetical protein n=1 Tax=Micromonospora sp. NPDC047548 TaxID=3155624 RepID=UPI0033D6AAB8
MSMQPLPWPAPDEQVAAAIWARYAGREAPLPVVIRDQLGELFADAQFSVAFGAWGRPGWSPGRLALVTVLQIVESLTDRQAAEAMRIPTHSFAPRTNSNRLATWYAAGTGVR